MAPPNDDLSPAELAEIEARFLEEFGAPLEDISFPEPESAPTPTPTRRARAPAVAAAETTPELLAEYPGIDDPFLAQKIVDVSKNLEISPSVLGGVIDYESGGSFDPAKPNEAGSGAIGLIQFMPNTARGLLHEAGEEGFAPSKDKNIRDQRKAAATERFANMTAVEQMDWVEKYLAPYKGRLKTVEDIGLAVFYPKAIGKPDYNIAADYDRKSRRSGEHYRRQNPGIEFARDYTSALRSRMERARRRRGVSDVIEVKSDEFKAPRKEFKETRIRPAIQPPDVGEAEYLIDAVREQARDQGHIQYPGWTAEQNEENAIRAGEDARYVGGPKPRGIRAATTRTMPISGEPVVSSIAARIAGLQSKADEISATLQEHAEKGDYFKGFKQALIIAHEGMIPKGGIPLEEFDPEHEKWTPEGEEKKDVEVGWFLPTVGTAVGARVGGFKGALIGAGVGALASAEWNSDEPLVAGLAKRMAYLGSVPDAALYFERLGARGGAVVVDAMIGAAETLGVENPKQYAESARQAFEDRRDLIEREEQAGVRGMVSPADRFMNYIEWASSPIPRHALEDAALRISEAAFTDEAGRAEIFKEREEFIQAARIPENIRSVYEIARQIKANPEKEGDLRAAFVMMLDTVTWNDLDSQGLARGELDVVEFQKIAEQMTEEDIEMLQLERSSPDLVKAIRMSHEDESVSDIKDQLKTLAIGTFAMVPGMAKSVVGIWPEMSELEEWAETKLDVVEKTGGSEMRQIQNWFERALLNVEEYGGSYYVVESTGGKWFRWLSGAAPEVFMAPLEMYAASLYESEHGPGPTGLLRAPKSQWDIFAAGLARIGTGEVGIQPRVTDIMKVQGMQTHEGDYVAANYLSIFADFLVPFESPFISMVGRGIRTGLIQPVRGAQLAKTGREVGLGSQGFLAGALPWAYKLRHGITDRDPVSAVNHYYKAMTHAAAAQGKNPLDILHPRVKDNVIEALRVYGVDPKETMVKYGEYIRDSQAVHGRASDLAARGDAPGDTTMRQGEGYREFIEVLNGFSADRKWDPRANPIITSVFEMLAARLASDPDVVDINTPQDFFENVIRLQRGGEPGPGARFQLADEIPGLAPVEYSLALDTMNDLARVDVPKGIRTLEHEFAQTNRTSRGQKIAKNAATYEKFGEYREALSGVLKERFGDEFNVYALMPKSMLKTWRGGSVAGPISVSLTPEGAHALKRHHPIKRHKNLVMVEIPARADDAWMMGSLDDFEIVMSVQGKSAKNLKAYPLGGQDSGSVRAITAVDIRNVSKDLGFNADTNKFFLDHMREMTGKDSIDALGDDERALVFQQLLNGTMNERLLKDKKAELTAAEKKNAAARLRKLKAKHKLESPYGSGVPKALTRPSKASTEGFGKPIALGTRTKNAAASFERLDEIYAKLEGKSPLESDALWDQFWHEVSGQEDILVPPKKVRQYLQDPQNVADLLDTLTPRQIEEANAGVELVSMLGEIYGAGQGTVTLTGQMALWSIMSRTLSAYPHESGFIDAYLANVKPFIKAAAEGKFTDEMLDRYHVWVGFVESAETIKKAKAKAKLAGKVWKPNPRTKKAAIKRLLQSGAITKEEAAAMRAGPPAVNPEGSGQPAVFNLNDFGARFLRKAGRVFPEGHRYAGKTALQVLHDMVSDRSLSSKQVRREWHSLVEKSGIDNKILSFLLLAAGRTDVIVIDRVQANHFWDVAGGGYGRNITDLYEGYAAKTTKKAWVQWADNPRDFASKRGLADALNGARGLALYEVIEDALLKNLDEGYRLAGRPEAPSAGRFHWESWVASSGQEVGHGTLGILLREALDVAEPARGVYVREGKFAMKRYGIRYVPLDDGARVYVMDDSAGRPYVLDSKAFKQYNATIDKHTKNINVEDRIVPRGFLISDPEAGGTPWFHRPSVDRVNLDKLIAEVGRRATLEEALLLKARARRDYGVIEYPRERLSEGSAPLRIAFGEPPEGISRAVAPRGPEALPSELVISPEEVGLGGRTLQEADAAMRKAGSGRELAEFIAENADNKTYRELARRIAPYLDDTDVHVIAGTDDIPETILRADEAGTLGIDTHNAVIALAAHHTRLTSVLRGFNRSLPDDPFNDVFLRGRSAYSGTTSETALHELLHAATVRRLHDGNLPANQGTRLQKATSELFDLTGKVIRHANEQIKSGAIDSDLQALLIRAAENEKELLAYGLTNRKFQDFLMTVRVDNQSAWSLFVQKVADLLGISRKDQTALGELLRISDDVLDAPLGELPERSMTELIAQMSEAVPPARAPEAPFGWWKEDIAQKYEGSPLLQRVANAWEERMWGFDQRVGEARARGDVDSVRRLSEEQGRVEDQYLDWEAGSKRAAAEGRQEEFQQRTLANLEAHRARRARAPEAPAVPGEVVVEASLTGVQTARPELETLKEQFLKVSTSINEAKVAGQDISALVGELDEISDTIFSAFEPALRSIVDDPRIKVESFERGFGGWGGEELEPNIKMVLSGDESAILDRIATFNSTSGMLGPDAVPQGGALNRIAVGVIDDAPNIMDELYTRTDDVLRKLIWNDGGVERLATLRIETPEEMLTPDALASFASIFKKNSLGFTVDRGRNTLEFSHTPEWGGRNAADTLDAFVVAARALKEVADEKYGATINIGWVKERILISEPKGRVETVNNSLDSGVSEYRVRAYAEDILDVEDQFRRIQAGVGRGAGDRPGAPRQEVAAIRQIGLEPPEARPGRGVGEPGELQVEGAEGAEGPVDPTKTRFQRRDGRALGYFEWDQAASKYIIALFRDGDINTLWHESGHLVSAIMGDKWMDKLVRYFDNEVAPDGNYRLTDLGEEQLADAWASYMQVRFSPSGPVKRLFEQLLWSLKEVWRRLRGKNPAIPDEMRKLWDRWLRPDIQAQRYAVNTQDAVMKTRHPIVDLEPTASARIEAEAVKKAGRAREAGRVDLRPESVRHALGGKSEVYLKDISPDPAVQELVPRTRPVLAQVDAVETVNNAIAYVATEHWKRGVIGEEWVRLTLRTFIPKTRMARIDRSVRNRLSDAIGTQPKNWKVYNVGQELPEELSARLTAATGLVARTDQGRMELSPAQAAGFKTLVHELAAEPLANIIPDELLAPDADFRLINPEQYNRILEVIIDVEAGVSARATRYAENISPTLGHAMVNAVKTMAKAANRIDKVQSITNKLKEIFVVPKFGEGYIDPVARDIFQGGAREMGTLNQWLLRTADSAIKNDDATVWREVYKSMIGQLMAPVDPGQTSQLFAFVDRLGGVLEAEVRRLGRMERGEISVGDEVAQLTVMEINDHLDTIQGLLQNAGGLSDEERAALRMLRTYENTPIEALTDADLYATGDAVRYLHKGLWTRKQLIIETSKKIASGLEGSTDANLLIELSVVEEQQLYNDFFAGDFEALFDWAGKKGRELGADPLNIPEYDQSVAVLEMIARMRAHEIIGDMTRKLAEYGVTLDPKVLTAHRKFGPGTSMDRDKFVDRVAFYINKEMTWDANAFRNKETGRIDPAPAPPRALWSLPDIPEDAGPGRFGIGVRDYFAYTTAHKLIAGWGFKLGKGKWERKVMPDGTEALMPLMVIKELDDAVDRAAAVGQAWTAGKGRTLKAARGNVALERPTGRAVSVKAKLHLARAFDTIMNLNPITASRIKMGITTGLALPNPAYYVGVSLGALFQAYQTQGAYAAGKYLAKAPVTALRMIGRRPDMVGSVVARMWKEGGYTPHAPAIVTRFGQVYTDDMVAHLAIREGMSSSFIKAETTQAVARDIKDKMPRFGKWIQKAPRWWQQNLIEVATAIDNYYRVSIFVDELTMGKSPTAAASIARKAGFDYADLTEIERKWLRNIIMFYSYQRKNIDLFWDTFLRNPERLIAQMRLIRGSQRLVLDEDDPEVVLDEYMKTRLFAGAVSSYYNAHFNSGMAFVLPQLPVEDAVGFFAEVYDLAMFQGTEQGQEALKGLVSRTAPWIQGPFVLAGERDFYFGYDINRNNVVPTWLIEMDANLTGGQLADFLDVWWQEPEESKLAHQDAPGRGRFIARNGKNWWVWRNLVQIPTAGRSMHTISAMDRANLGPVDTAVELSALFREAVRHPMEDAGWLDPAKRIKGVPHGVDPDDWRKQTMLPRPDLYEGSPTDFAILEFFGLMGARPKAIKTPEARAAQVFKHQRFVLRGELKEME